MELPTPDPHILARKDRIVSRLREVMGDGDVIHDERETRAYECDALSAYRCPPLCAVLPTSTAEVAAVLKVCHEEGVPVVPGAPARRSPAAHCRRSDAVILGISRMNRGARDRLPQPRDTGRGGAHNLSVTGTRSRKDGFFYAPDPSSQLACAIAGNIAMNSGGAHCLKYGVTTNNLLGVTMVLMDGTVVELGGAHLDPAGYDWLGLVCGSEGQLGVVTEATLPDSAEARGRAAGADGLFLERGGRRLRVRHHQGRRPAGGDRVHGPPLHPRGGGFRLGGLPRLRGSPHRRGGGARRRRSTSSSASSSRSPRVTTPTSSARAIARGKCRDLARPEVRLRRDGANQRLHVPRRDHSGLRIAPNVLGRIREMSAEYGLDVANVFHSSDGNMHPLILFNANEPGQARNLRGPPAEILKLCVEVGGCLTGEHGVGIEKRDLMNIQFAPADLEAQMAVKDVFDPAWRLNPARYSRSPVRPCAAEVCAPRRPPEAAPPPSGVFEEQRTQDARTHSPPTAKAAMPKRSGEATPRWRSSAAAPGPSRAARGRAGCRPRGVPASRSTSPAR